MTTSGSGSPTIPKAVIIQLFASVIVTGYTPALYEHVSVNTNTLHINSYAHLHTLSRSSCPARQQRLYAFIHNYVGACMYDAVMINTTTIVNRVCMTYGMYPQQATTMHECCMWRKHIIPYTNEIFRCCTITICICIWHCSSSNS